MKNIKICENCRDRNNLVLQAQCETHVDRPVLNTSSLPTVTPVNRVEEEWIQNVSTVVTDAAGSNKQCH